MTAIRKLFLALAGVTVLTSGTTAFAQVVTQPSPTEIACNASAIPTLVRVQGKTEQIGDIILTCTGGTPTAATLQVPTANFSIQTSQPLPGVTSKELGVNLPVVNGGYPFVESVLAINDPIPTAGAASPITYINGAPSNLPVPPLPTSPAPNACPASNTGSCLNTGNGIGGGAVGNSYGYGSNYNIFQGYLTPDGVTHFDGIPIDAPGTNSSFTIRITNIKIDATLLASYVNTNTVFQSQNVPVTASVAITGTQQLATELLSGIVVGFPANGIYANQPVTIPYSAVCTPNGAFSVDVMEGHAAAFKRQNNAVATVVAGTTTPFPPTPQDSFASQYYTESGYYNPALAGHNFAGTGPDTVGLATQGTRIYVLFQGIPANTTVYLPTVAYLYGGSTVDVPSWLYANPAVYGSSHPSGAVALVTTAADGSGAINPIAPTTTVPGISPTTAPPPGVPDQTVGGIGGQAAITVTGTTTYIAVYEVLWSDPTANETLHIPGAVIYTAGAPTYTVPPSYLTATPSLAPISGTVQGNKPDVGAYTTADYTYPRFTPGTIAPLNEYYLIGCQCDLLFPYIVDQAGLTTGVAIANTSVDPYGDTGQAGYVSLYFYPDAGSTVGTVGTPLVATTANKIAGGDEFLMVVGGTGYDADPTTGKMLPDPGFSVGQTAGFQGYMIAITGFQYCHGYAFITDTSVDKLAEGYLALVLDESFLARTGNSGTPACGIGCAAPSTVHAEHLVH
jgi:hypothetical protein